MRVLILSLFVVLVSCKGSKKVITASDLENFKNIIENKKIEVNANFAQPFGMNMGVTGLQNLLPPGDSVGNINLIGNPNYFIIRGDSLDIDLPYYGQQRMARGYNTSINVEFSGKISSLKKEFNTKKKAYIIEYEVKADTEMYTIFLTLYINNTSNMVVNSSKRSSITYIGNWKEWKKEKL